jgi:gamma-glutamyltranspeptidase/glutathione hydrolase
MPPHRNSYRPVIMGRNGVVASAHAQASLAGVQVLMEGGNAMDAAVAIGSTITVVEPYMSSIAGIGVMIVYDARTGERHVLDFVGPVPKSADPKKATQAELSLGPKACIVPGNCAGWLTLHSRWGTMPRERLFAHAIRLAEQGTPFTWKNCEFIEAARDVLMTSPTARARFLDNAKPGRLLVQKDLAGTFRQVAEGGMDAFYRGPIAKAICRGVQEAGGWLSEDDLANWTPTWRKPLTMPYRGYELATTPLPFPAWQMLATLNILEGDDLAAWGHNSEEYLHHLVEAFKLANADRVAFGYDDAPPLAGLLSKDYAKAQRKRVDPRRAAVSGGERFNPQVLPEQLRPGTPADFMREHTTHFAVADAQGNVVTVTQTLGPFFGSAFIPPGTGITLNSMDLWADLDPDSPQYLRPGFRPATNMSPMQIYRDGKFQVSIGTPGGYGILQTTVQMTLNLLAFGMNIQEAIEMPRVRIARGRGLDVESRIAPAIRDGLAARGHTVNLLGDWSYAVGGGQGLLRDGEAGVWMGGADPRRDGYALAF